MLAPKIVMYIKNSSIFMYFSSNSHTFSAHINAIIVYFITSLTKCTECDILSTYYKCVVYKIRLAYPKCCDKQGISNLNKIRYKGYQTRETSITSIQLSKSITFTVHSNYCNR